MADFADDAAEAERQDLERNLREHRRKSQLSMPAVGSCYNCAEDLPPGILFCDADCRDDYERRKNSMRR